MAEHRPQSATSSRILIPGLPNAIALTILARLPHVDRARLRGVCCSWKHSMESVVMSRIRKMLYMPEEVLFIFLPDVTDKFDGSLFAILDPFSGCFSRVCWPPQLQAQRLLLECKICCVIGQEVLVSAEARDRNTAAKVVCELEGLYSFDGACMRWNDVKFASRDSTSRIRRASAVDKEGGYLYAEADSYSVKRLDLKSKMWEALPEPEVRREEYWGAIIQNCFYIAGGIPQQSDCCHCCVPGEMWNPINRTWTRVPELERVWDCEVCELLCPSERLAVVKDQFYALSNKEGLCNAEELMWYEASSQRWISLGSVPGSDLDYDSLRSHLVLFAVGGELWLVNVPNHSPSPFTTMVILTTKPSLLGPLSWKILWKCPGFFITGFPEYAGEIIVP